MGSSEDRAKREKRILGVPTEEMIKKCQSDWDKLDYGRYKAEEDALDWLFKAHPDNDDLEVVIIKVSSLNALYSAGLQTNDYTPVARAICNCPGIGGSLAKGCPKLVNTIATRAKEKAGKHLYSFASKYCAFHDKERKYPLYDSNAERALKALMTHEIEGPKRETLKKFEDSDLRCYLTFRGVIEEFKRVYKIKRHFRQIDHYLWLKGRCITKLEKEEKRRRKILRELKERQDGITKPWGRATLAKHLDTLLKLGWVVKRPGIATPLKSEHDVEITPKGKRILEEPRD